MLYAHTPAPGSDRWHGLGDHLRDVAAQAATNAAKFGGAEVVRWAGAWHDLGKANPKFQRYLEACHASPERKRRSVEHKGAGLLAVRDAASELACLAFLIQGHHGGLPNKSALKSRRNGLKDDVEAISAYAAAKRAGLLDYDATPPDGQIFPRFLFDGDGCVIPAKLEFFLRMCFSALVDADHLDTERHRAPEQAANRGGTPSIAQLAARLTDSQREFVAPSVDAPARIHTVAQLRNDVYRACLAMAAEPPGFFRLTVPTGGGKTRSSLAFALHHVLEHAASESHSFGLERVIVAVPYLTITEQTADDYRKALGDDRAVLEHHSGVAGRNVRDRDPRQNEEEGAESGDELWRTLATQDWDAPIIVTTTVQLFESLFGRKPGSCRKLHRIARSVVVLDEAQTLPPSHLQPILDALRHLVADYGTSVLMCTATQPALDEAPGFRGLPNVQEIAPDPPKLFDVLKRVTYKWPDEGETWTWADAAEVMRSRDRVLTIVNTRADALALLAALGDDPDVFHLSALLCGAHRRDVLAVVRRRLKEKRPCRLVSTQVVEAGVNLDFPLVLRAMGPLDRIVQAAGRGNREWEDETGLVIVFDPSEAKPLPAGAYEIATGLTRTRLARGELNLDQPATFTDYFRQLYRVIRNLDRAGIEQLQKDLQFEDVTNAFELIEDDTVSVVVPYTGLDRELRAEAFEEQCIAHEIVSRVVLDDLRDATSGRKKIDARAIFTRAQPYLVGRHRREHEKTPPGYTSGPIGGLWVWERGYDPVRGITVDRPHEDFVW